MRTPRALFALLMALAAALPACGRDYSPGDVARADEGDEPEPMPEAFVEPEPAPEVQPEPEVLPEPEVQPEPDPEPFERMMVLSPIETQGFVGEIVQFRATVVEREGNRDVTVEAEWSVEPRDLAEFVAPGRFRVLSANAGLVEARFEGLQAQALLEGRAAEESLVGLAIEPAEVEVPEGFGVPLRALGIYDNGESRDLTALANWRSDNPMVAQVSTGGEGAGIVSGFSQGAARVTAQIGDFTASAEVQVTPARLEEVEIVPSVITLPAGDEARLQALGRFSNGALLDVTESVSWEIENVRIASVDNTPGASGTITGLVEGETRVKALAEGIEGSALVRVTEAEVVQLTLSPAAAQVPAGASVRLRASAVLSDDVAVEVSTEAVWAVADPRIAAIEVDNGIVRVHGFIPGETFVTATYGQVTARASLVVTEAALVSLSLSPLEMRLPVGTTRPFFLVGTFSDSSRTNLSPEAVWTISDASVALVANGAQGGLITARAPGEATLTARVGALEIQALVEVTDAELVAIQIQPPVVTVPQGDAVQLGAFGVYSDNSLRPIGQEATWSTSDSSVATVSNAPGERGNTSGVGAGQATVTARFGGLSDEAAITVVEASVTAVFIAPPQAQVVSGRTINLNAFAVLSNGSTQLVTQEATWVSATPELAQVSNANGQRGQVSGISAGSALIQVNYRGQQAELSVRVLDAILEQIFIAPQEVQTSPGVSVQLFAVGLFSDMSVRENMTGQVVWATRDAGIAVVNNFPQPPGILTGVAPGQTLVTATLDGVVGQRQVLVINRAAISLEISPASALLPVDAFQRFFALAQFDDGTSGDVTANAVWTSSDASILAVLPNPGLVNTLRPGEVTLSARFSNLEAAAQVTIRQATPRAVILSPVNAVLNRQQGITLQLFATGLYDDDSTSDMTQLCQWSSSNSGTLLVLDELGAKGLSFGLRPGSAIVTARCGNLQGTTNVTIR